MLRTVHISFLLLAAFVLSATAQTRHPAYPTMVRAAEKVKDAQRELYESKLILGIYDPVVDPNRTGLIGVEYSPITTTVGYLKAKRAATNPDFAACIVRSLVDHGIGPDDSVMVSMTGSFPGMNLSVLMALEVLDIQSLSICSIGASSYGANEPEFTWIDMEDTLNRLGLLKRRSNFVTMGGTGDVGGGLSREARNLIKEKAFSLNYPLLRARSLRKQMALRKTQIGDPQHYQLLINIGGNHVMLGKGPEGRELPGGWNDFATINWDSLSQSDPSGIVFDFLRAGIPVLNLLHIEDIARDANLPFDPESFTPAGEAPVYYLQPSPAETKN
ncbi:MAG: poly-gamma-glutamate system protein [Calditrichota bacterium]